LLGVIAFCINSSTAQICTINDLNKLFEQADIDVKTKIERIAAMEFHKLLNEYRKSKGKNELIFNETLWIASRNHCEYMKGRDALNHKQFMVDKKLKTYTGQNPGDRYDYASGGNAEYNWSGENILYNFSGISDDYEQRALEIAKQSIEQWKKSPGHNANMLNSGHNFQGTAFISAYGKIWAASLFARREKKDDNKGSIHVNKYNKKPLARKTEKFNAFKTQNSIFENLITKLAEYLSFKVKQHNRLNDEARFVARNLLNKKFANEPNNQVVYTQKETTTNRGFMGIFTKEKSTYTLVIEKELNSFDEDEMSTQLAELVNANQTFNAKNKVGLGVAVKKQKNTVRIALVSVVV